MGTCTFVKNHRQLADSEFYRQEIWGDQPCTFCSAAPVKIEIRVALPASKIRQDDPTGYWAGKYGAPLHLKRSITTEPLHQVAEIYACGACAKQAEQGVAQRFGTSSYVMIDRGPSDKIHVPFFVRASPELPS